MINDIYLWMAYHLHFNYTGNDMQKDFSLFNSSLLQWSPMEKFKFLKLCQGEGFY